MPAPVRITRTLLDVLQYLCDAHRAGTQPHGWAIMRDTKRLGPTVYGVLDRLEDAGWVTGSWEDDNPAPGKPRRRLYCLTEIGVSEGTALLAARRPQDTPK